jgi:hypothetical protein
MSRFGQVYSYMFEQELYNAPPTEKSQEGDLFHSYEIKNWEYGPRIYKILAIALVFNLGALFIAAQTDVLTTRGCDSPWVGSVCQVLDMAYVSTVVYGAPDDYVDEAYEQTDLDDAEVVFVDVSGETPPIAYPEGYFQIANPVQYAEIVAAQQSTTSGYTTAPTPYPTTSNDMMATTPVLPPPNPNSVTGETPDSPFAIGDNSGRKKARVRNKKSEDNTNADQAVAQTDDNTNANTSKPVTSDPLTEVEINKRPLVDLGNSINEIRAKTPVNLESEFVVMGKGKLKDGKFDPKTFKYGTTAGKDEAVVNIVKESIEAINEAGYLNYIKDLIGKELSFTLQQDVQNIQATFQSDLDTESLARQRKSSLDLLISLAKKKKQGENPSQNDKDDLLLLDGVTTEALGKTLIIKFVAPKTIVHPMIQRKLAEQAAEKQKPSGSTAILPNNNNSLR